MFALAAACLAGSIAAGQARSAPSPTPENKVALGVSVSDPGRPPDLDNYVAAVGQKPAIVMWFQSFDEPLYYNNQMPVVESLGAIPMITWDPAHGGVGVPLRDIAAGAENTYLKQAAAAAVAWGKPMFIRFAHEMNLSDNPWGAGVDGNTPADYVAAWRHVVQVFRDAGASNVAWVWSPNVDCGGSCPFDSFYPGDQWVDWVALDGYNYGPAGDVPWMTMAQIFGSSYDDMTAMTSKPLMIAETASTEESGDKAAWITNSFASDLPGRLSRVRAVIWFDHVGETDWRVNSSAAALAAYRGVAASPLHQEDSTTLLAGGDTSPVTPPVTPEPPSSPSAPPSVSEPSPPVSPTADQASSHESAPATQPQQDHPNPSGFSAAPLQVPTPLVGEAFPVPSGSRTDATANADIRQAKTPPPSKPKSAAAPVTRKASAAVSRLALGRNGASPGKRVGPLPIPGWFRHWVSWRRHGANARTRPPVAPHSVPRWAWKRLRLILHASAQAQGESR